MSDFYKNTEEFELMYDDNFEQNLQFADGHVSPEDGMNIMLNRLGCIDLAYWSKLCGVKEDALIKLYAGKLIWLDPDEYARTHDMSRGWITKNMYLRGNIVRKYNKAVAMHVKTGLFSSNIQLLKDNMPDMVDKEDIHVNLGATWVPPEIISGFLKKLFRLFCEPKVTYNAFLGKWHVDYNEMPYHMDQYYTYGTREIPATKIIKKMLNAQPIKVYDKVYDEAQDKEVRVLNQQETLAAHERERLIHTEWQKYLHSNPDIETKIQEAFMLYYGYTITQYDGSYLTLPDLAPGVVLHPHQKKAIAHIIMCKNTLLAHHVGSGKTYEYSSGIHELIRMGISQKALIVVPNTTLESASAIYRNLYPGDKVFVVYPGRDFTPSKREETLNIIKSSEYNVIFMAYSSFDMLSMSFKYLLAKKEDEIRQARREMLNAVRGSVKSELRSKYDRLQKMLVKFKEEFKDSQTACFDELGIDILCVDEAHNYKNISLDSNFDNIVGLHSRGSKKANSMMEKVRFMQEQDGHVIFATGTPITNSLADLYVLQKYLQPDEMKMCKVYHFSDWINTFCEEEHSFEVDVDGANYRFTTRFNRFHNLPELMSMFSEVCDFYQSDSKELGLPEFNGYTDLSVRKSKEQKVYNEEIVKRTEAIRNREVKSKEDNLLKITINGRQAALDIRLVCPDIVSVTEENKVKVCAREITRIYFEHPDSTQIVFSDISTPKDSFNIYDELKRELVLRGLEESEIAFIHDAVSESKRSKLEKAFNKGEIKVLIGSTQKLGTGTNVQERLLAVHHLDVPWRPADMVQREGRIIRQGNLNDEVFIYRYVTEGSFDSYTWQILENKQKFISQFLSGALSAVHRDESDCADTVLTYSEIKALAIGNPLIKERVEVSNRLERARVNQRRKRKELLHLKEVLYTLPGKIVKTLDTIEIISQDMEYYQSVKKSIPNEERQRFGEKILEALKENVMNEKETKFEDYQGFEIYLPKFMQRDEPFAILKREGGGRYKVRLDGDKALGCSRRFDHVLDTLPETKEKQEKALRALEMQKTQATDSLNYGNQYDEQVDELSAKLQEIDEKLKEDKAS